MKPQHQLRSNGRASAYRVALGWSTSRLAAEAGVNRYTIEKAESGQRMPQARTILKLASALAVPFEDYLRALLSKQRP